MATAVMAPAAAIPGTEAAAAILPKVLPVLARAAPYLARAGAVPTAGYYAFTGTTVALEQTGAWDKLYDAGYNAMDGVGSASGAPAQTCSGTQATTRIRGDAPLCACCRKSIQQRNDALCPACKLAVVKKGDIQKCTACGQCICHTYAAGGAVCELCKRKNLEQSAGRQKDTFQRTGSPPSRMKLP